MAERPDLDAIENVLNFERNKTAYINRMPNESDVRDLLTYCRELELENKRLRENLEIAQAELKVTDSLLESQP